MVCYVDITVYILCSSLYLSVLLMVVKCSSSFERAESSLQHQYSPKVPSGIKGIQVIQHFTPHS